MADESKVVVEFVADTTQLTNSLKSVSQEAQKTGAVTAEAFNEFNKVNQKAVETTKTVATSVADLNKVVANGAMKEYSKDLEAVVGKLYDEGKIMEALITKYGTAQGALKAMQKELGTMASLGQRGTKEFKELAKATAELQDTIQDTRGEIKKMASDTRVFDTMVQSAKGVAAAFSVVTGVTAALGDENKDLQKELLKVQGAMAALQGVQELANIATEKGGLVTQAYGLVLKGVTAIEEAFGVASGIAWGIATAGVTLVIAGLAELYLHWQEVNDAVREFLGLEKHQKVISDEVAKERIENFKQIEKIYDDEIALRKSKGEDVRKLEIQRAQNSLDILENERKKYGSNAEFYKFYEEEKLKLVIKINEDETAINEENSKRAKELLKKRKDEEFKIWQQSQKDLAELLALNDEEQKALWKKQEEDYKNHISALAKLQGNNNDRIKLEEDYYNHIAEIENAFNTMSFEDFKMWEAKKREEWKADEAEKLAQLKRISQAEADTEKQRQEDRKAIGTAAIGIAKQTSDAIFQVEANNREQRFSAELAKLEEAKNKELDNKNLTNAQRIAIDKKYAKQEAEVRKQQWQAEQDAKLEQAIINGALAVTTLMATTPPTILAAPNPAFYASLALLVAQTAAQVAIIESAKPPKFAKGTEYVELGNNPRGVDTIPAYVNEGERIVPTHINKQLAGIKNEDLPKLIQAAMFAPMPHAPEMSGLNTMIIQQPEIDYKKLGKIIAEELRANPQTHINIDKGGFSMHLIDKQKKVTLLNNRYES